MGTSGDTDEILAIKFPHLRKSWLQRVDELLGIFKADKRNGGNVEITTRFRNGRDEKTEWRGLDISEP